MAKLTKEEIVESLKEMTLLEVNELVKAVEEAFGVTAAVATVAAAGAAPAEEAAATGPSEVSVYITNLGQSKVAVLKVVQAITGKSLMEAKGLTDKLPALIKEKIAVAEADDIKAQLLAAGAEIEVK